MYAVQSVYMWPVEISCHSFTPARPRFICFCKWILGIFKCSTHSIHAYNDARARSPLQVIYTAFIYQQQKNVIIIIAWSRNAVKQYVCCSPFQTQVHGHLATYDISNTEDWFLVLIFSAFTVYGRIKRTFFVSFFNDFRCHKMPNAHPIHATHTHTHTFNIKSSIFHLPFYFSDSQYTALYLLTYICGNKCFDDVHTSTPHLLLLPDVHDILYPNTYIHNTFN